MESVHNVFTADEYLTGCDKDEQRSACMTSCEVVFNIRFRDNPRDVGVFFIYICATF